uniref:Myb-like domain-containing protein n=1 Tax=Kalanchoe fedtschenkoi TaxID=63787 RepID=A0A7N0VI22_KALFE
MELFPAQPDLSLLISPPSSTTKPNHTALLWPHTSRSSDHEQVVDEEDQEQNSDLGFWNRALNNNNPSIILSKQQTGPNPAPSNISFSNPSIRVSSSSSPKSSNITYFPHHQLLHTSPLPNPNNLHLQVTMIAQNQEQLGYMNMKPIRGIPIYHQNSAHRRHPFTASTFPHQHQSLLLDSIPSLPSSISNTKSCSSINGSLASPASCFQSSNNQNYHNGFVRSRFLSRFPGKKNTRAPRMRWTSTLHARFVHAVELLGGHERATPKSVLELMDVKDLTLAHVKSHLQMYRTVKTTDRAAATSDAYENGSSGDNSEDMMLDIQSSARKQSDQLHQHSISSAAGRPNAQQDNDCHALWSNSSREARLHAGKPKDSYQGTIASLEGMGDSRCLSFYERSSEEIIIGRIMKKPNLEFTLGRAL